LYLASDRAGRAAFHPVSSGRARLLYWFQKPITTQGLDWVRKRGPMTQWIKNRQTALVLALVATLFMSPMLTGPGFAGGVKGDNPTPDQPPGDGKGDPDVPFGPSRVNSAGAQRAFVTPLRESRTVGDGRIPYSIWTWRLRIVLRGLKAYTFRF
jgi:hypothetical protein